MPGVRLAACEAGIRYQGRTDLMLAVFEPGTTVAGVLTRSKTCSAPVLWCRTGLEHGKARALVVNSGNANAFTGKKGREATRMTAEAAARAIGCGVEEVYLASTGVIGEPLDAGRFVHLIGDLAKSVKADAFEAAARAIMTTDTYAKLATRTTEIGGVPIVINGFCKGAGMMAPDMATMLCFIFTDAAISQPALQGLLAGHAATDFQLHDGGWRHLDERHVLAVCHGCGGKARPAARERGDRSAPRGLQRAPCTICCAIWQFRSPRTARASPNSSPSRSAAPRAGPPRAELRSACANSPIVKAAISGEDPNWGRVVMAIGKAGEAADRDKLSIWFGPHIVARDGERAAEYVEETVAAYMKNREIVIRADVGVGSGSATVWTCDLTHDYISINADYRS